MPNHLNQLSISINYSLLQHKNQVQIGFSLFLSSSFHDSQAALRVRLVCENISYFHFLFSFFKNIFIFRFLNFWKHVWYVVFIFTFVFLRVFLFSLLFCSLHCHLPFPLLSLPLPAFNPKHPSQPTTTQGTSQFASAEQITNIKNYFIVPTKSHFFFHFSGEWSWKLAMWLVWDGC